MPTLPFAPHRKRTGLPLGRFVLLFMLILTAILPAACARAETGRFFSDPAQPIQVQTGQAFVITLPSEQAGAYEWQLAQDLDPARLQLTASKQSQLHYVNTPDDQRNQEYWIFMPAAPGHATIALAYFSPNGAVGEERVFEVDIR